MSIMEMKENYLWELKQKFFPTFTKSCAFWLPAQTINFLFVHPQFRVIYMGFCGFVWVNLLCYMKRHDFIQIVND